MDDERLTSDPNFSGARDRIDAGSETGHRTHTGAAGFSTPLNSFLDILAEIAFEDALEQNREAEERERDDERTKQRRAEADESRDLRANEFRQAESEVA
jgi:hypothetical protein